MTEETNLTVKRDNKMELKETTYIPPAPPSQGMTVPKAQRYQSRLKYYIHDSIDTLRLELTGQLAEDDLGELTGCWRTAKTTLGQRRLLLDLRCLQGIDGGGRQWLNVMSAQENASFLPEHPHHLQAAGPIDLRAAAVSDRKGTRNLFEKLVGFCRGTRVSVVKSSTPAP